MLPRILILEYRSLFFTHFYSSFLPSPSRVLFLSFCYRVLLNSTSVSVAQFHSGNLAKLIRFAHVQAEMKKLYAWLKSSMVVRSLGRSAENESKRIHHYGLYLYSMYGRRISLLFPGAIAYHHTANHLYRVRVQASCTA